MDFPLGALVSLPAWELQKVGPQASLIDYSAVVTAPISDALRAALSLLAGTAAGASRLRFAVRPEIFTDGVTLRWLDAQCAGVKDHVHLSDGSAVRLIPGFRNHVFFYGLGWREDAEALRRLERRLPEVFGQFESQINSALRFRLQGRMVAPPSRALGRGGESPTSAPRCRRFFLNWRSAQEGVARMEQAEPFDAGALRFETLHYVRPTENGLADPEFARAIARLLARAIVTPGEGVVLVPPQARAGASVGARLRALVDGLLATGIRHPAAAAPNLLVAAEDLAPKTLEAMAERRLLVVDDCDPFWIRPTAFNRAFASATVFARRGRHHPIAVRSLLREAYGPATSVVWTTAARAT